MMNTIVTVDIEFLYWKVQEINRNMHNGILKTYYEGLLCWLKNIHISYTRLIA